MARGEGKETDNNWFNDAQRIISMIIVLLFVGLMMMNAWAMFKAASVNDIVEMQKQLNNALINIVMVIVGFYFGSSKSSQSKDASSQKVTEKLAEKAALPVPPGAPMQEQSQAVIAWWSLLTDAERNAITAAADTTTSGDARVAAFIAAAKSGAAQAADLDYLASKGLLTPDRAAEIQKTGVA